MKQRILLGAAVVVLIGLVAGSVFAQGVGVKPGDRVVYQKLDATIVSFTFNEQPLEEALDFLQTLGKVNIVLDKKKVEAGKTVTLKLNDVPLGTAVKLLCEQIGLKWTVRDGIVFMSDEDGVKQEPITVVYDVNDLLAVPPNFEGPQIELQSLSSNRGGSSGGSGGGGGCGGGIFGGAGGAGGGGSGASADEAGKKSQEELLTELVDLIKQVIAPGTWDDSK